MWLEENIIFSQGNLAIHTKTLKLLINFDSINW